MARKGSPPPSVGLVLVRVFTGGVLLVNGWRWLKSGGLDGELLRRSAEKAVGELHPLLAWWGETVVLYNVGGTAFLSEWAALVLGLLLFIGAFTRPVGWIAVFFLTNAFAFGPESHQLVFLLLLVSCLACALSRAGRRVGFDKLFDGYFPSWLTWTRTPSSFLS